MSDTPHAVTTKEWITLSDSQRDLLNLITRSRDEFERKLAAANAEIASVRVVLGRVYGLDWKLLPMSKVVSLMKENLALAQKDALLLHSELAAKDARIAELEKGEYICKQCGLRKDAEHGITPDF